MKALAVIVTLLSSLGSAFAEDLKPGETTTIDGYTITALPDASFEKNYKGLMQDGFQIVGTQFFETDFVVMLARGQDSFLCTLALVKEEQSYSGGPWNDYRSCKRLSGGADYVFNAATGELEPVQ